MGYFNREQSGFIHRSTIIIFWVLLSMSSVTFADDSKCNECTEYNEYDEYNEQSEYNEYNEYNEYDEVIDPVNSEYMSMFYSGAAITLGAHSNVFGNTQSVAATTLGEAAKVRGSLLAGAAVTLEKVTEVSGDVQAGEATTLGASAFVSGDVAAAATVFIDAGAQILGELKSGGGVKLGAAAKVVGSVMAKNSITLGADAQVGNNEYTDNVLAVNGSIVLRKGASVKGDAKAGTTISLGLNAKIYGNETQYAEPENFTNRAEGPIATKKDYLTQKQKELADMPVPTYNELTTTIDSNKDLYPGVYHASALTTTAGITLTFVGSGYEGQPEEWIINTDTYISFGANLKIDLVDIAPGSTIIFNSGSYTTIGANSSLRGTIYADTYITTGENTTIEGVLDYCGGMFATNGAITLGAHSTFGVTDCRQAEQYSNEDNEDNEDYRHNKNNEYVEYDGA
jgi:MSHA biogenesis protein MshQ